MSLNYDHKIVDLFSKLICGLARHPHDLIRVEAWQNDRFAQAENFTAASPDNVAEYVKFFEGSDRDIFVHLGSLRPDILKSKPATLDDFLETFGCLTDGGHGSSQAAAQFGKAEMVLATAEDASILFLFPKPQSPAVLKRLGDEVASLTKSNSVKRHASIKVPFPGTLSNPTTKLRRSETEYGSIMRAPKIVEPKIVEIHFPETEKAA